MIDDFGILRRILGDSALSRLTGLDRRTLQRIEGGQTALHDETATRLHAALDDAAAAARRLAPPRRGR